MSKLKQAKVEDFIPDPKNFNKHSEIGMSLLGRSLRNLGAGRSIVVDSGNNIIAGNGVQEIAIDLGITKAIVIETVGDELIVHKRMDIQPGSPEFYQMALADNVIAQKNLVIDAEVLEAVAETVNLGEWKEQAESVIPGRKTKLPDADKANFTQATFQLSHEQGAIVEKAIKISRQLNKDKFDKAANTNSNGNSLFFIMNAYVKKHQNIKLDEE